ncbi:MAG: hypothetical protein JXK05_08230 [Campylobacterales bacterium]|nr:hypothetical protein [Campylobacterales bacterium]
MEHQILVLLHLIGAILFVGAIALEVIVLEPIKKHISIETFQMVEFYLFRRIKRTYWPAVMMIYMSGFYMYGTYVEAYGGMGALLESRFGQLLTLKMLFAIALLGIFATAPFAFMTKQPSPLKHFFIITGSYQEFRIDRFEIIHYAALSFGLLIVILAKVMWMV